MITHLTGCSWPSDSGHVLHTCRGESMAAVQGFLQNVSEFIH